MNDTPEQITGGRKLNSTEAARKNHEQLFPDYQSALATTDPEFIDVFNNFAFYEVIAHGNVDVETRVMMILTATLGCQALTQYKVMMNAALSAGITPVAIKEILYQATAYIGIAKANDFLKATNDFFTERGISLPLEGQSTTTPENRFDRGLSVQKEIFGDAIDKMYEQAPKGQRHIQEFLSANCFGDFYTRTGLDLKTRELVTLSILIGLGGTDSQIKGHIKGNANVGHSKDYLVAIITQLLPYVGYPRTLTALACLNEVLQ